MKPSLKTCAEPTGNTHYRTCCQNNNEALLMSFVIVHPAHHGKQVEYMTPVTSMLPEYTHQRRGTGMIDSDDGWDWHALAHQSAEHGFGDDAV